MCYNQKENQNKVANVFLSHKQTVMKMQGSEKSGEYEEPEKTPKTKLIIVICLLLDFLPNFPQN